MAKQMSYTDPVTGVVYAQSVWFPVGVYVDVSGPSVKIDFLGYKDLATAAGVVGKSLGVPGAVGRGPVGTKSYVLTQQQFAALAASVPGQGSLLNDIAAACYEVALSVLDTDDPGNPGQKVSFFHGATEVSIQ